MTNDKLKQLEDIERQLIKLTDVLEETNRLFKGFVFVFIIVSIVFIFIAVR